MLTHRPNCLQEAEAVLPLVTGALLHHPPAAAREGCFISADREQFTSAVYISIEDMSKKYY